MWIFTQHGFFSVVRGDDTILPDGSSEPTVQVRARYRQHLEELRVRFPEQLGKAQVIRFREIKAASHHGVPDAEKLHADDFGAVLLMLSGIERSPP